MDHWLGEDKYHYQFQKLFYTERFIPYKYKPTQEQMLELQIHPPVPDPVFYGCPDPDTDPVILGPTSKIFLPLTEHKKTVKTVKTSMLRIRIRIRKGEEKVRKME